MKSKPFQYKQPVHATAFAQPTTAPLKDISDTQKGRLMIAGAPTPNCKVYERGRLLVIVAPPDDALGNGWMLSIMHESRTPTWNEVRSLIASIVPQGVHMAIDLPDVGAPNPDERVVIVAELPKPEFINGLMQQRLNAVSVLMAKLAEADLLAANERLAGYANGLRDSVEFLVDAFGLTVTQTTAAEPEAES